MLDYSLHENHLTERTDDFIAHTHVKKVYNKEQFIDLMPQRGTLMTKTDALAVLNNIEETVAYIVGDGLNLPRFNVGFALSGVGEWQFECLLVASITYKNEFRYHMR